MADSRKTADTANTAGPGSLELIASVGADGGLEAAEALVRDSVGTWVPVAVEAHAGLPGEATCAATVA